jgi:hypothetical protein
MIFTVHTLPTYASSQAFKPSPVLSPPPPHQNFFSLRLYVSTDSFWSCSRDLSSHFSCSIAPFFLSSFLRARIESEASSFLAKTSPPSPPKQRLDCAAKWREAILSHSSSRLLHSPRRLLIPPKNLYWTTICSLQISTKFSLLQNSSHRQTFRLRSFVSSHYWNLSARTSWISGGRRTTGLKRVSCRCLFPPPFNASVTAATCLNQPHPSVWKLASSMRQTLNRGTRLLQRQPIGHWNLQFASCAFTLSWVVQEEDTWRSFPKSEIEV